MKGTNVYDRSNTPFPEFWGKPIDNDFLNNTGIYSIMLVERVVDDSIVIFSSSLREDMEPQGSKPISAQLIKVPYAEVFQLTEDLEVPKWDTATQTGGVLAVFASDKLDMAGHNINGSFKGFRGGDTSRSVTTPANCDEVDNTFYLDNNENLSGRRGASIVYQGYSYTRGNNFALGGGGGGPGRFGGGAGGSSLGQGGRGGAKDKISCTPAERFGRAFALNRDLYSNDKNRLFLGSGGGSALPELGLTATPGGDGGGIIIIITDTLAGNQAGDTIWAAGEAITDTSYTGGSGGGAGGFIVLDLNHVEGNVHLDVSGGKGGGTFDPVLLHGPGGGGGGGVIWHSDSIFLPGLTADSSGGVVGQNLGFTGDHNAAGGLSGTSIPELVIPLRGFYFNFISGSQDICQDSVTFTILGSKAKGDTAFIYTWQDSIPGGGWANIAGASGSDETYINYSPGILTETTWYRRIVTKTTPPIESDTSISLVVKNVFTRLGNNNIKSTDTICYDIVPVPLDQDGPAVTGGKAGVRDWRWQAWQASSPNWVDASGLAQDGDAARIDFKPENLRETTYFRRQVVSYVCTHISDSLTITVLPDITGNTITGDDYICQFTVPGDSLKGPKPGAGDGSYEYVWQGSGNKVDWDSVHTERNYFPGTMDTVTTWYRRVVYSGNDRACISISDTIEITVDPIIQQLGIAQNTDVCYEYPAPIVIPNDSIFGGNGTYNYIFQDSLLGRAWIVKQSGTQGSYDPGPLTDTTWYWRIVESGACTDTSNIVKYQVQPLITGNTISPDYTICAGESSGIIGGPVPSGGDGAGSYIYRWDRRTSQTDWSTTDLETTKDLPPKLLNDSTWFRRVVISGACVDTLAISVVNAHARIGANEIWTDSLPKPEACVNLSKLIRGRNESSGLMGGTGNPADFQYLWERYNSLSGIWENAPSEDLSNDQNDYLTEVLNTTGSVFTYRRYVESGECDNTSDSMTFEVKPRPIGSITASAAASACVDGDAAYDIDVPVVFTGGIGPYTLYYDDGQGEKEIYFDLDTSGIFQVSRGTEDATQYFISLDTIYDGNGCWVTDVTGEKEAWVYRDSVPAIVQDTFKVCGELVSIAVIPGLGSTINEWGPASPDYEFSAPNNPSTTFTLNNWGVEDFAFNTLTWTQKNGVCTDHSASIVVEQYRKPLTEMIPQAQIDSTVYFRQLMDMWAAAVPYGRGTWTWTPDVGWGDQGGTVPTDDIHNPNALVDLGGTDNLREPVTRHLSWTVGNKECPDTTIDVTIERYDLVTYSAFSPNGDPFNEFLILDGLEYAEKFTMQIFSRHGRLVKSVTENDLMTDEYGERNVVWDGKMENGNEAEDGTYFYMIEVEHAGQKYQYKNYLELVRADPNQ